MQETIEKQILSPLKKQAENSQSIMNQQLISDHFFEYSEKMIFYHKLVSKQFDALSQKMIKEEINYKLQHHLSHQKENFQQKIVITTKSQTINKEVVVLKIQWGCFQCEANILNIIQQNKQHGMCSSSGCYGNIYQGYFLNSKIAIKCIPFKSKSTRFNAIKQWFLLKIASTAQFGPKLLSCFGFDILMFQTCCEFAMEVCQVPKNKVNSNHMLQNLAMMHKLHMVHLDIKPQNIMLSPSFKKPVFIDFGLSKIIFENIGEKSLTQFIGTITFCTEEMKRCFLIKQKNKVDLYFNDLFALQKSLALFQCFQETDQKNEFRVANFISEKQQFSYLDKIVMKFYLYKNRAELFFSHLANLQMKEITAYKKEALTFLLELFPTTTLKSVFLSIQKGFQIESQLYSQVKLFFQLSHEKFCSIQLFRDEKKYKQLSQFCQQFFYEQSNIQLIQQNNKREISELLLNQQNIKKLPFQNYIKAYLQFMSYTNNKHQVTSLQREKTARMYYSLFISEETSQQLKGRTLINETMLNILHWGLCSEKLSKNPDQFAYFVFCCYDFIFILNSENSDQFLTIASQILNHPSLLVVYKQLLLLRIKHSLLLIPKRLLMDSQQSRMQFFNTVLDWIKAKQQVLISQNGSSVLFENIQMGGQKMPNCKVSQKFMEQFGRQILSY